MNNLSVVEERILINVTIARDEKGSFGLQITEGSDGHVYIQSVIDNGPAYLTRNFIRGDQVIAVNGKSLLELKYNQALNVLKNSGNEVEFLLARLTPNSKCRLNVKEIKNKSNCDSPVEKHITENCRDISNVNKYGIAEVPYHKHIRYEIETGVSNKKYPFNRTLSKSCTHLDSNNRDKAVVVELIPKENVDLKLLEDTDEQKLPIAVPRSLGLSRRWRGPVKYPVTPIKKINTQLCDSTFLSTSDEEQIFI